MSREKESYRDCMAMLNERFPNKDMLNIAEAAEFCGMSRNTVKKRIRFNAATRKITKADLARQVCI